MSEFLSDEEVAERGILQLGAGVAIHRTDGTVLQCSRPAGRTMNFSAPATRSTRTPSRTTSGPTSFEGAVRQYLAAGETRGDAVRFAAANFPHLHEEFLRRIEDGQTIGARELFGEGC